MMHVGSSPGLRFAQGSHKGNSRFKYPREWGQDKWNQPSWNNFDLSLWTRGKGFTRLIELGVCWA